MLLLSLLVACGPRHGGTGDEGPYCAESNTELALAEDSPLGFAAATVLAYAEGEHAAIFTWGLGGESDAVLTVAAADSARFVDGEPVYPDGVDTGLTCDDRVEIDATVSFSTDGGELDERWDLALLATDDSNLSWSGIIDNAAFDGTFTLEDYTSGLDYDHLRATTEGSFDAAGGTGSLSGEASGTLDCSDTGGTCTDWTEYIDIGSWATEPA